MLRETPTRRPIAAAARVRRSYFECRYGQLHVHNSIPPGGGFEEAAPLLCLHDWPGSGRVFARFLALAGADRSAYAPDLPGFGESDPPAPGPGIADYAGAIGDFLDSMHLRHVDLLGQRAGALIATELAVTRPAQIGRVVMASAPLLTEAERQAGGRGAAPAAGAEATLRPPDWERWATQAAAQYPLRERLARLTQRLLVLRPRDELWEATGRVREALPGARLLELEVPGAELFASYAARVARAVHAPPPAARRTEAPPAAGAAQARQAELAQQALSAKLHEAQELLAAKSARLTQAERARDAAYAARAAAEQRTAQLNTELGQVRAELAFQLDELTRARVQSEEQVAQSRAVLSTESARAEQLQRQLGEQESTTRTQRSLELEQRRLAEQDRTRAAGTLSDLQRERERALGYLESLQSAEGRRLILEGLATELQRQVEERERDLARAGRELAGRDAQARELQAELARRTARITQLEQQVSSFGATLARRDTQLRETRHETQGLQGSVATPRARGEQHGSSDSLQHAELARLQAQHADLTAAVESARAATLATNAQAAGHGAALEQLRSRNAELEATLIT